MRDEGLIAALRRADPIAIQAVRDSGAELQQLAVALVVLGAHHDPASGGLVAAVSRIIQAAQQSAGTSGLLSLVVALTRITGGFARELAEAHGVDLDEYLQPMGLAAAEHAEATRHDASNPLDALGNA